MIRQTVLAPLAAFVALCGGLLLLTGGFGEAKDEREEDQTERAALRHLEGAQSALEADNYGRAEEEIRRAAILLRADLSDPTGERTASR